MLFVLVNYYTPFMFGNRSDGKGRFGHLEKYKHSNTYYFFKEYQQICAWDIILNLKATFYFSELLLSKIEVFEFSLNYLTEVTCPKVGKKWNRIQMHLY